MVVVGKGRYNLQRNTAYGKTTRNATAGRFIRCIIIVQCITNKKVCIIEKMDEGVKLSITFVLKFDVPTSDKSTH